MDELLPGGGLVATDSRRLPTVPAWLQWLFPVLLIALLVGAFLAIRPLGSLREVPPIESVAFERVTFQPDLIEMRLRNDGPDPVTIAQVLVNETYWEFSSSRSTLERLQTADMSIAYPWEAGLPVSIALVTSTGVTIEHDVEAAALTPPVDAATLWVYALLGVYIGVIPVAIGILWFPALRRASKKVIAFLLAFTVGLLAFLLVDTTAEGFELAAETPLALDGLSLFVIGAASTIALLTALDTALQRRRSGRVEGQPLSGLALAYLIAGGIGLHNMGEGLAVGAALATGEAALGTFLIIGFALHNTTEGLAIVAPLGERARRPALRHFVALGAIAGAPAIAGAWLGGFAFSATWASIAFGVAAGAIAQVIWQLARGMRGERGLASSVGAWGFIVGLLVMYATGLIAG